MAKQLENSLERFTAARPVSFGRFLAPAATALLLAALATAAVSGSWLIVVFLGLSLIALIAFMITASKAERQNVGVRAAGRIDWEACSPEIQRQNLNISVCEISRSMGPDRANEADLQSAFIVGEDLALRQIQQEEGVPVLRHVSVGGVPFDAVFIKGHTIACGDFAFLVSPELSQERALSAMRKIAAVKSSIEGINAGLNVRLMMVLVTQMSNADVAMLRNTLRTTRFSSTPVDIDIRLLDFESLQQTYITEK